MFAFFAAIVVEKTIIYIAGWPSYYRHLDILISVYNIVYAFHILNTNQLINSNLG